MNTIINFKKYIKRNLKKILNNSGYNLISIEKRNDKEISFFTDDNYSYNYLYGLLTYFLLQKKREKKTFNIIQVGANDGKTVDPVYPFAQRFKNITKLLLIEPQTELIRKLKNNYSFHNNITIANVAIGITGNKILYKIRTDLQKYYEGIIGSGITSENKKYVEDKAFRLLPKRVIKNESKNNNSLVESFKINSTNINRLLDDFGYPKDIDWLQIDAEGFDDEVIYNSNIEIITPSVISYEISHFSSEQHVNLSLFLEKQGYYILQISKSDECAIKF